MHMKMDKLCIRHEYTKRPTKTKRPKQTDIFNVGLRMQSLIVKHLQSINTRGTAGAYIYCVSHKNVP